jgi:hypothetical protein
MLLKGRNSVFFKNLLKQTYMYPVHKNCRVLNVTAGGTTTLYEIQALDETRMMMQLLKFVIRY